MTKLSKGELKKRLFNLADVLPNGEQHDVYMDGVTFYQIRDIIDEVEKDYPIKTTPIQIADKYGLTVLNWNYDSECSEFCVCGHHASVHQFEGTAGICKICTPYSIHNFTPISHSEAVEKWHSRWFGDSS
jgi:hypothetical protein